MSNAADGYLGDWLPHKEKCRCVDCELERSQKRIRDLESALQAAQARAERLSAPVSDAVWIKHSVMSSGLRVAGRDSVNALIAARKEKP